MLPEWLIISGLTAIFYQFLEFCGPEWMELVLKRVFGAVKCDGLNAKSLVHSTLASFASFIMVYYELQLEVEAQEPARSFYCMPASSWFAVFLPPFELGFGLHDLAEGIRLQQWSFLLHGIIVSATLIPCLWLDLAHHMAKISIVHFSTIFLNLRRADFGDAGNLAVDVTFMVTFMLLRVFLLPRWFFDFLSYGLDGRSDPSTWGWCMNFYVLAVDAMIMLLFSGLNFYWAVLLVQKTYAKLVLGESTRAEDGVGREKAEGHRD